MNAAGNLLAVGAPFDGGGGGGSGNPLPGAGAVRLYSFSDSQFSGAALKGTIGSGYTGGGNIDVTLDANAMFGASVALSGDGKTLAVGAPGQWGGSGAVHQFRYANADFSGAVSKASLGSHYNAAGLSSGPIAFGTAVALNNDGGKLAVGAVYDDRRAANAGTVYLFNNSDLSNVKSTQVLNEGSTDALYGTALAFNGVGDRLAVGAIGENAGKGAVYLYKTTNTELSLLRKLSADAASTSNTNVALLEGEYFGSALAFNAAGTRLAVGAPSSPASGAGTLGPGAVRIYDFADTGYAKPTLSAVLGRGYATAPDADIAALKDYDSFGFALAMNGAGDRLVVGAPYSDGADGSAGSGSVHGFTLQPIAFTGLGYGNAAPASGNSLVNSDSLQALLGAGTSVTLQASNDITLAGGSGINSSGSGSLTLQAGRSIALQSSIKLANGSLNVVANEVKPTPDSGPVDAERDPGAATLTVDAELFAGGSVNLRMADGAGKTNRENGAITVNANVRGGKVGIRNQGASAGSDVVLGSAGTLTGTGYGDAIEVVAGGAGGGTFTNNSSAGTGGGRYGMQTGIGGRILVYSNNPAATKEGYTGYSKRYGQAYTGATPFYAGGGDWFFYAEAPQLTVIADSASRVYDGLGRETLTFQVSGLIDGDSAGSALNGALRHHGDAKQVGSHAIELGSLASQLGYRLQLLPNRAQLTITPKALTVTATGVDKVYDGKTAASVIYGSNAIAGDALGFSGNASFADKSVGAGKAISVNGITLTGADAGNYTLGGSTASTSAGITPRTLTASASSSGKVYDGLAGALVTLGDDRIAGDQLSLAAGGASYADKNAGLNKTITVSGITLSGSDAANYVLAAPSATTTADIAQRTLNVSASGSSKVYDGSASAGVILGDDRLNGDQLSVGYGAAAYADKHAGGNKTITVSGLSLDGSDAGNYKLASATATGHGDITRRVLTTSVSGGSRVYDGTVTASANYADDRVRGDAISYTGDARYADKNAGADKAVSVNGIAIGGADAGNYTLAATSATTTGSITPRTLTASVNGTTKVYDGGTAASVTLGDDRVRGDQLALAAGDAHYADKNAGAGKAVAVSGITLAGADAGNYVLASASAAGTGSITPKILTFNATGINKVYDGTAQASVNYGDDRIAGDVFSYSANASFAGKQVGKGLAVSISGITLGGTDAGNYALAGTTATATADITPRTLSVSADGASKVYDGTIAASVTLGDDRVSGDQLTLAASGNAAYVDKHAGSGKAVSIGGVTLSGADAANYVLASATATGTGSITPKALTASVSGIDKVYDGKTTAEVAYGDSGRIAGDQLSVSGEANFAGKNAGAGKTVSVTNMRLNGADAGNYRLVSNDASTSASITPRALTATIAGGGKVYDGGTAAQVAYGDDRVSGDALTLSGNAARYADKNVGADKAVSVDGIVLGGADAGNYILGNTTASTQAAITPRTLVFSGSAGSKVYDGSTAAIVSVSDNRVSGDVLSVGVSGAHYADKNVGSNKAVLLDGVSLSGADAANYALGPASSAVTGSITPRRLTVSASGANKVYDGQTAAIVSYGDDRLAGDVLGISGKASFADKHAGSGKAVSVSDIALSGTDAGNYTLASTSAATQAAITPRALVVTAQGASKVYDGLTTATATLSDDRIAGDQLSVSGGSAAYADKSAGSGKALSVGGITLSGADARNYALASATASGRGDITPRDLKITVSGVDKVYDGSTSASISFSDDRLSGDAISYAASANFADKNVGQGKTVSMSGVTLGGADAGNYRLTSATASTTASIRPRALNVSASGVDKVYDGTVAATVAFGDDRVAGDQLSLGGEASFASKNAGVQQLVFGAISVSGADAGNYVVNTSTSGSATIAPRRLVVSASGADKVYDGGTTARVTLGSDALAGDALQVSGKGAFADKHAGANKTVTVGELALSGADAGNYRLDGSAVRTSAAITPRTLTASVSAGDKVYDGTAGAVFSVSDDRIAGDALGYSGASAAFDDKNAGSGKRVTVSGLTLGGADAGNYRLASSSASTAASILRKTLTVTADNQTRVAGTANLPFSYAIDGLVAGDSASLVTATASSGATAQSAAGSYAIALAGTDLANYKVTYVDGVLTVLNPSGQLGDTIGAIVQTPLVTPNGTRVHPLDLPDGPGLTPLRLLAGESGGASGPHAAAAVPGAPAAPVNGANGASLPGLASAQGSVSSTVLPGGTRIAARDGGMRTEEE
ncbi:YDG domain-containing protein [Massilia sp. MB5]|uniref:beta strand repeat-containing protein n=1 Tax=Massilia sp. MB5 TaxID=2919578 RepID=UPI0027D96479|nr:YDG domain-containing protein [Massilia sp. MB5]